jgi:hypothetical protein
MLTERIREVLLRGWYRLTRGRHAQESIDAASRRVVLSRARFWAELRQGRREAAARWKG